MKTTISNSKALFAAFGLAAIMAVPAQSFADGGGWGWGGGGGAGQGGSGSGHHGGHRGGGRQGGGHQGGDPALSVVDPAVKAALKSNWMAYRNSDAGKADEAARSATRAADRAEMQRIKGLTDPSEQATALAALKAKRQAERETEQANRTAAEAAKKTFATWTPDQQLAYLNANAATSPQHLWDGVASYVPTTSTTTTSTTSGATTTNLVPTNATSTTTATTTTTPDVVVTDSGAPSVISSGAN